MTEILLIAVIVLALISVALLVLLLRRGAGKELPRLSMQVDSLGKNHERLERILREEMAKGREESGGQARQARQEVGRVIKDFSDSLSKQLSTLSRSNEERVYKMRVTVEGRLKSLQEDNSRKLDQMRSVVDEKLHATLEKRLGESFKQVSERLEQVHKGLGEMQSLASGVGDLKKVLSNVKNRGILGEIQLSNLLEQVLTVDQYGKNVAVKPGSREMVEFAVKLPGRNVTEDSVLWLPIDAKFPLEDYQRLVEAREKDDPEQAEESGKYLEANIKQEAKKVKEKYIDPPHTTDFGIIFLPVEGLYAEVLRRPGLFDALQREYKVLVAGPTTLWAILNSLQMGFRTLAIQKRSSEVWSLLSTVKTEFGRFGEILDKTQKKLKEAGNTLDSASTRTRAIERKLRDVQELPGTESRELIEEGEGEIARDES